MKRILITGSNGFIGRNLIKYFQSRRIVDVVNSEYIDLSDSCTFEMFIQERGKYDVLIHTAALTRAKNWQTFQKINIDLTEKLLELSVHLKQFIFISSQAAAGPWWRIIL